MNKYIDFICVYTCVCFEVPNRNVAKGAFGCNKFCEASGIGTCIHFPSFNALTLYLQYNTP